MGNDRAPAAALITCLCCALVNVSEKPVSRVWLAYVTSRTVTRRRAYVPDLRTGSNGPTLAVLVGKSQVQSVWHDHYTLLQMSYMAMKIWFRTLSCLSVKDLYDLK